MWFQHSTRGYSGICRGWGRFGIRNPKVNVAIKLSTSVNSVLKVSMVQTLEKFSLNHINYTLNLIKEQESPPAWTQEAYRPRRIKHSICCPIRGGYLPWPGGYLPWLGGTYSGSGVATLVGGTYPGRGRVPILAGGYTHHGHPHPPPPRCGQNENITSRLVLRTRSVIKLWSISPVSRTFVSQDSIQQNSLLSRKLWLSKEVVSLSD